MIKAAIFDLDGTLQDSEVLWVKATQNYLSDAGCDISDADASRLVYGRSWRSIYADILLKMPGLKKSLSEVADSVRVYFNRLSAVTDMAIPGSVALCRRLAQTMPVAIVSGSTREDVGNAVKSLKLQEVIQFYLGCEDYGSGKPAPDCFLLGAKLLGAKPQECVIFEDSSVGVAAAKSAGALCVAIALQDHPKQRLDGADLILQNLNDFDISRYN